MAKVWKDRVAETTATTGTGTITLAGAVAQHQGFSAIETGNTVEYCLLSGNGTDWETGLGTVTISGSPAVTTLSRDTIYDNSVGGSPLTPINLTGTSTIFCTLTSNRTRLIGSVAALVVLSGNQALTGSADNIITNWTATGGFDQASMFNGANPSRLTVPSGYSYAQITCGMIFSSTTVTTFVTYKKNGSFVFAGRASSRQAADNMQMGGPWLQVVAGDYFEIDIFPTSGVTLNLDDRTFFALEVKN